MKRHLQRLCLVFAIVIGGCETSDDGVDGPSLREDGSMSADAQSNQETGVIEDSAVADVAVPSHDAVPSPADARSRDDATPRVDATPIIADAEADAATEDPFELTSTGFSEGEQIPYEYTCFGEDVQPKLVWQNPPEGTQSFALVLLDETIDFVHWVAYNIPGDVMSLRRGASDAQQLPEGVVEAPAYGGGPFHGPCTPPPGPHTYGFRLYALDATDVPFPFRGQMSSNHLEMAFGDHTLAVATLTGTCQPPP
jgi:Raf kinase inhibitor-like YbhB/YbcL family protein